MAFDCQAGLLCHAARHLLDVLLVGLICATNLDPLVDARLREFFDIILGGIIRQEDELLAVDFHDRFIKRAGLIVARRGAPDIIAPHLCLGHIVDGLRILGDRAGVDLGGIGSLGVPRGLRVRSQGIRSELCAVRTGNDCRKVKLAGCSGCNLKVALDISVFFEDLLERLGKDVALHCFCRSFCILRLLRKAAHFHALIRTVIQYEFGGSVLSRIFCQAQSLGDRLLIAVRVDVVERQVELCARLTSISTQAGRSCRLTAKEVRGVLALLRRNGLRSGEHVDAQLAQVGAHALLAAGGKGAVEKLQAVEVRGVGDTVDLRLQSGNFLLQLLTVQLVLIGAVGGLLRQCGHTVEHVVDFGQRTFRRLDEADAVLGVLGRALEAGDLRAHLLGDREACGVVAGAVDGVTGGQLFKVLADLGVVGAEVAIGIHRGNIMLNTH